MNTRFLITGYALAAMLSLSACNSLIYDAPTAVTTSKAEVYQDEFTTQDIPTGSLNAAQVGGIAQHYWSNGDGPLLLSVSYDPASKKNTAMKASQQAEQMATTLRAKGVRNIESRLTPIDYSGDESRTIISFKTLKARPPTDCPDVLSMNDANRDRDNEYKMGCSVETYAAKQIARPKDFLGNDDMDNGSGRREANVLDVYQQGKPSEELQGLNASEKAN